MRPAPTAVFLQREAEQGRRARGFPSRERTEAFYSTLPQGVREGEWVARQAAVGVVGGVGGVGGVDSTGGAQAENVTNGQTLSDSKGEAKGEAKGDEAKEGTTIAESTGDTKEATTAVTTDSTAAAGKVGSEGGTELDRITARAAAAAARAALVVPYGAPRDPRLPAVTAPPDASEEQRRQADQVSGDG